MKKSIALAVAVGVMLFLSTASLAQDWTKEQTELWKVVEDTWMKWKTGDIDGMATFIHERYQGWSSDAPLPVSKSKMMEWYKSMKDVLKVSFVEVEPARITITKEAAVVDYYFSAKMTYTMGEEKKSEEISGKNVEFYVKDGGKWLLLGDMTVFKDSEDD